MNSPRITLILLTSATLLAALSLFGGEGLVELRSMRSAIAAQEERNRELRAEVREFQNHLVSLQTDRAALEREVRRELLLGRPDEIVVLFEERLPETPPDRH